MSWFEHETARIYYEESGEGEAVLLLPGFAGSTAELSALQGSLLDAGYKVIAGDLPGSGRSGPQPRAYTATYYEEDARSFIALLRHLGAAPAHLIGFSDGGEVSLLMAALSPNVARSVVTWGSAGAISDPEGQLRAALYGVVDDPIPPLRGFRDYLLATYGEGNARAMTQSLVGAQTAIIERGGDISVSRAARITCPVLLIAGEHDFLASPQLVSQLAAHLPQAKVVIVDGAGHSIHHERPEWLAEVIVGWLNEQAERE